MRVSRSGRSDRYADYKGSISRLGHSGNDRVLRRNFAACVQSLMAVEKVLTTVPMGSSTRRDLHQARRVLADRLYLLEVERETNPTVAAFVEAKRSKGDERDLATAVDKYTKMKKSEKQAGTTGGGDSARGLATGLATTLGPQRRLSRSICRRRRPRLQEDSSEPRRGQGSALTVSSRAIGGEMPRVRRRIKLELLHLFLSCWTTLCIVIRLCSNLLTPQ
jgi:hypothetical protein